MAAKHWRSGLEEFYRSFSKAAFVHSLQRLVPEVTGPDLIECGSGVRAQALRRDGTLLDDFHFVPSANVLHFERAIPCGDGVACDWTLHNRDGCAELLLEIEEIRIGI